jgi:hypothetical protein
MTTRTFKQYGYGISTTDQPVTITVTLDGQEIFNGAVSDDSTMVTELFTWEMPLDFASTQLYSYEITVQNGSLHLGRTQCNYSVNDYNAEEDFGYCCIVDVNGIQFLETFSNVVINQIPQQRVWEVVNTGGPNGGTGQWHWTVQDQGTFSATITVQVPTHYTA